MMMLNAGNIARPGEIAMPSAMTIAQTVSIKGTGAEHVGGVEGAVDRVAMELLSRLERGKTLVVWAFDASGSLARSSARSWPRTSSRSTPTSTSSTRTRSPSATP